MDKLKTYAITIMMFLLISGLNIIPVYAADVRSEPIDVYILIDTSFSMKDAVADAAEWICGRVVDDILGNGDRVTVWTFSDGRKSMFDRETVAQGTKDKINTAVRKLTGDGKAPNISEALQALLTEAQMRDNPRTIAYILVASSLVEAGVDDVDKLLKYSRVEARPGWKAVVVGVDIEKSITDNANAYLQTAGSP